MSHDASEVYSVGIATVDITPPVGTTMAGFAGRKFHCATAVYHPLRAVAVAITDGQTPLLILSAEWVGFYDKTERIRDRLHLATGIPREQIVLIGTHTHCGPAIREKDIRTHGRIDADYLDHAVARMAKAASIAWTNRYDATLAFGVGHCDMAMSRRVPDPQNPPRVLRSMTPNPDGPADHDVPVMTITSLDGILRGVLFSYACHTTSRGGLMIGGDYAGFTYDYLQEQFPMAQPCFLQGCAGDQKPRPVGPNGAFGQRSVEQVREIGFELGQAVAAAVAGPMKPVRGAIELKQSIIQLETEPLDREFVQSELNAPTAPYKEAWARYHQDRIERGLPEERQVPFEIQTIRFGQSLGVVTLAGEMTVEHSLRLKRDLGPHFEHVLPLAYTNNIAAYVPVRRQFAEFGYEVLDANMWSRRTGRFVEETEDLVHTTAHAMLGVKAGESAEALV